MNLCLEALSREIERVTVMKQEAEEMVGSPWFDMWFYIETCRAALENGHKAAAAGDIGMMVAACKELQEIN